MFFDRFNDAKCCHLIGGDEKGTFQHSNLVKYSKIIFFYMSHFAISTCDGKELISFSENSRHVDNFSGFIYIKRL